jgi:predicted phosphoribosyltransferase
LVVGRLDADRAVLDVVAFDEIVEHLHRQRALGALDRQGLALDVAVTPDGIATGFYRYGTSEHLRQHFAADILVARFGVRQNAARASTRW